jgi:dCMP deaminase
MDKQLKIDKIRLTQAYEISKMSSCVSRQVGTIITVDNRIVSEGRNGTPSGYINCNEHNPEHTKDHHDWSNIYEIHAELNAILWAARRGTSIDKGTIYCTTKPCVQCTKNIIASGIIRIVYSEDYPLNDNTILDKFLSDNNIIIEQIKIN